MQNSPLVNPNRTVYVPQVNNVLPNTTVATPPAVSSTPAQTAQNQTLPSYVYPPQYYLGQQQQPSGYGSPPSASGVNIQIFNPTAVPPGGFMSQANNYFQNMNGYQQQPAPQNTPPAVTKSADASVSASANIKADIPEKKYKKDVVQLTDQYVQSLENYLNSQDSKIRAMGAKELMKRFEEDESRKNDVALTNLLNKTLKDPSNSVRLLGLSAINGGTAQGNEKTTQILNDIAKQKTSYGFDAELAASAALKRAGQTVQIETDKPPKEQKEASKKNK